MAVVLFSSVGFTTVLAKAGRTVSVLSLARSLPAGAVVTAGDLQEVRLGVADAGAHVVPAAEKAAVVGQRAVLPLAAGALLSPGEVGARAAYPPAGKAQASFAVEPGGLPAGLSPGQRVAVFAGPAAAGAAEQPADAGQDAADAALVGVVTDVAQGDRDATAAVVTVLVDTAAASRAARIDKPRLVVLSPADHEVP